MFLLGQFSLHQLGGPLFVLLIQIDLKNYATIPLGERACECFCFGQFSLNALDSEYVIIRIASAKLYTVPLVLSGALFPLMQWTGRAQFVVVIVQTIDEELPSFFITFLAWSIAEASETVDFTNKTLKENMQEILKWVTMLEILH
ncbi:unnamed protein product [Trifolium pratense]|uniref:Uncharacterized protein n=1 Tax=Trifolium pratense TaxID=57577 RepID=A0ACB0JM78_TRIPR|nr:unnamed protein product [Trifolium pratense]